MALGPITVIDKAQVTGTVNNDEITFTGDGAYPAGGTPGFQALCRKAIGKGNITILYVVPQGNPQALSAVYDADNDKLKVYTGTTEASGGANHGSTTFRMVVVSK